MPLTASQIKKGDRFSSRVVENLSRTQIVQYAGASGDYNPLHTDEIYAVEVAGYKSIFAHGMLTMGLTGKMLTDLVGDGRLKSFGVRFIGQVFPGDTLETTAIVEEITSENLQDFVSLYIETTNENGEKVLTGNAVARIDQ